MSNYHDKREGFFRSYFEKALPYSQYVATGSESQRRKWEDYTKLLTLPPHLQSLLSSFTREMNVLVMSGIWCGDCARQGPMLHTLAQATPTIHLRFIESKENPELQEELRISGAERVPVAVVLSEDFYELVRFGDRHLSVYQRKARNELGAACDPGILPPSHDELSVEMGEWGAVLERAQLLLRLAPQLRRRYGD